MKTIHHVISMATAVGLILGSSAVFAADNVTAEAQRKSMKGKTAQDQNNSERDVEVTRMIRAELNEKDFSMDAKNVKIITVGSVTTLKGPVESVEEKARVLEVAKRIASKNTVRDEMTVTR